MQFKSLSYLIEQNWQNYCFNSRNLKLISKYPEMAQIGRLLQLGQKNWLRQAPQKEQKITSHCSMDFFFYKKY